MPKPIFVLNGPNLNLLGVREPHIYGTTTLDEVRDRTAARAQTLGFSIDFRQSNHEGVLIDWVQAARTDASALVINPAGLGHTSIALLDALKALTIPIVECHLSNPAARESFRRHTYVSLAATGQVTGFGAVSYELAVEAAARLAQGPSTAPSPSQGAEMSDPKVTTELGEKPKAPADPIDTRLVRRLADILKDTGLTQIEVERGDLKIRVARELTAAPVYATAPMAPPPTAAPAPAPVVAAPVAAAAPAPAVRAGDLVKSPMVGTVYLQPQPGADAFVKVGDTVAQGQTLMIIEAMKTMNPVPAPRAGKVVELLVGDSQPVEFGEPLIVIE